MNDAAQGFAVTRGGKIQVSTVSEAKQTSAIVAMHIFGLGHVQCGKEGCDCAVRLLAEHAPDANIVSVTIIEGWIN